MSRHPVVVTTARRSGSDDLKLRQRRYALTQAVRLGCFLLAVFLPVPLPAKLVLVVAAFVLPWMGVVAANGGPSRTQRASTVLVPHEEPVRIALEPGRDIDS